MSGSNMSSSDGGGNLKIMVVWPVCRFSVWDVARGYRSALSRLVGESNIKDYFLDKHVAYHSKAIPEGARAGETGMAVLSKFASGSIVTEALYFGADLVVIVSGLNVHPAALWALRRVGIATVTILTESPYEDDHQANWLSTYPEAVVITTERTSAADRGWTYIPHAYDPEVHYPVSRRESLVCDVVMVGTGWTERQRLLEQVDWSGINLKLYGLWPGITESSPLLPFYSGMSVMDGADTPAVYSSARVCLNIHRPSPAAESMGPRTYELAACGAYQICDRRQEVGEVFGDTVPMVESAEELEHEIRWALSHPAERLQRALRARELVMPHTFDTRARDLLMASMTAIRFARPRHGALPAQLSGMVLVSGAASSMPAAQERERQESAT